MKTNKTLSALLVTSIVLGGLLTSGNTVLAAPSQESVAKQEKVLKDKNAELKVKQDQLAKLNNDISKNVAEKEKLELEIKEIEKEITETEVEMKEKEAALEKRKEMTGNMMKDMQSKNVSKTEMFLDAVISGESFSDVIQKVTGINTILSAQEGHMEQIKEDQKLIKKMIKTLNDDKIQLDEKKSELEKTSKTLGEQKKKADNDNKELKKSIDELKKKVESDKKELGQSTFEIGSIANSVTTVDEGTAQKVIDKAKTYLGIPYVWGGTNPAIGLDCSGLTQLVYASVGINLPRVTTGQETVGRDVSLSELQAGDMLYWGARGGSYHVAIYIGGGQYLHAPTPGEVVKITKMTDWMPDFAKRVLKESPKKIEMNNKVATPEEKGEFMGTFNFTRYSAYDGGAMGITAGGTSMANGNVMTADGYRIIAVDRSVMPLGTVVRVETSNGESFLAKADDTGGAINGNKIDISESDYASAIAKGNGTAKLYRIK